MRDEPQVDVIGVLMHDPDRREVDANGHHLARERAQRHTRWFQHSCATARLVVDDDRPASPWARTAGASGTQPTLAIGIVLTLSYASVGYYSVL